MTLKLERKRERIACGAAIAAMSLALLGGIAVTPARSQDTTTALTPGSRIELEGEQGATPQQFRYYRSYGRMPDAPDPHATRLRNFGARGPGVPTPGTGDFIAPVKPVPARTPAPPTAAGADRRAATDAEIAACAARYRTFNPATETYMTSSGQVRRCPLTE